MIPFALLFTLFTLLFTLMMLYIAVREVSWSFGLTDYAVITLVAMSAGMHLTFGLLGDRLLLFNGAGYYLLLLMLYWPIEATQPYRRALSWSLLLYTLITFAGYFIIHWDAFPTFDTYGLINKAVELILLLFIALELGRKGQLYGRATQAGIERAT